MSIKTVVLASLALLLVVNGISDKNTLNNYLFNGDFEFFDLTYDFDNDTIYWPNAKSFEFIKQIRDPSPFWYASNDLAAGEHGGTHIDAPFHFAETGKRVGDITLDKLILPLIVVDISSEVNDDANFVLKKHHLTNKLNHINEEQCVIVFKFGWSKYFYNRTRYLGVNEEDDTLNFPGISGEVAELITTKHKNIVGVGVDVASIDPGSSPDYPAHRIILGAGLYNLENVKLVQDLPDCGCTVLVMPMKIAEGTGAPTRLVSICPKR